MTSVIGCSTCSRVLTSRKAKSFSLGLVEELDRAGAAVSGGADQFGRHASQVVGLLPVEYRRAGLLDHLLVAALDRAVAHARRPDGAVAVGDDLDLDVAGVGDQAFEEHHRVAERALGLALRALERDVEFVGGEHLADAAAAAATAGLDDQRVADVLRVPAGVLAGRRRGRRSTVRPERPTFSASSLASTLSPSVRIASAGGPMKVSSIRSHSSAKAGSSATKPQPTHTASALVSSRARSSSAWSR